METKRWADLPEKIACEDLNIVTKELALVGWGVEIRGWSKFHITEPHSYLEYFRRGDFWEQGRYVMISSTNYSVAP
jgi:hypothetical protein